MAAAAAESSDPQLVKVASMEVNRKKELKKLEIDLKPK